MASRLHMSRDLKRVDYLVLLASLYSAGRSEVTVITEGHHFMLAFPENLPNDCHFSLGLSSVTTSDVSIKLIRANISVPAINVNKVLTLVTGSVTNISLRESGLSPDAASNVSRNNIIFVDVTAGKLSIFGSIICDSASIAQRKFGEFLAIPVEFWGTRYVVISPSDTTCGYTVTVLTSNLSTEIKVVLKIRKIINSGYVQIGGNDVKDSIAMTLEPNTRTDISAVDVDMTGTILESNFAVGLLVGPNNDASLSAAFCNDEQGLFIEQLIPTYAWGKRYYLNDGGASSNVRYRYNIRVVTSTALTTVYYDYLTSYENQTLKFKNSLLLRPAGGIYDFSLRNSFGFEMVAGDFPVMVMVYTSPTKGGDGAMSHAVQARSWPERVVLRFSPVLGHRVYLFTETACQADMIHQVVNAFDVSTVYTSLDYEKLGTEFYIPSTDSRDNELQVVLSVNTDVEGCTGISAFIMSDVRNGYDVLAACPVFWSVGCSDGEYFHLDQKACVPIQTTTPDTSSSEPQLPTAVTSNNPENTAYQDNVTDSTSAGSITETTLLGSESTKETVAASDPTLYGEYSTQTVVTRQEITERNEATEPGVLSSHLADNVSTTMVNNITDLPTLTTTFSVTNTRWRRPYVGTNGNLATSGRNGSELTTVVNTPRSSGPFGPSIESDAADVDKTSVNHCPCLCQPRPNRIDLYDTPRVGILKVYVGNLSRHRRSRSSAKDSRPLSVSFGIGGIAVFVCVILFVLLPSAIKRKQSTDRRQEMKTQT